MKTRILFLFVPIMAATLLIIGIFPARAISNQPQLTTIFRPQNLHSTHSQPIIYYNYAISDIPTLDPQRAEDAVSINYIENLFVNLTNMDLETTQVVPEAATAWEISGNGLIYTFSLRTDIPWVHHNPFTGETMQVQNNDGSPRFVTADDFVYAIKRLCDPNVGGYYSSIIGPQIKGCTDVLNYSPPDNIPISLFNAIGASAPDKSTFVVELEFPASFFLQQTSMWSLAAVPSETIEAYGVDWIEADNIVTNGRYMLHEWDHNAGIHLWHNSLLPLNLQRTGNVDHIVTTIVTDTQTGYALWLDNVVDTSIIPDDKLTDHLANFPDETDKISDLSVFYFGFRMTKPPLDNVSVRRALSAAFDRQTFINDIRQGMGEPMKHFAPPGIFGAPPIDAVGIGYNVTYAQSELASAGYPDCLGMPPIEMMGYYGQDMSNLLEFARQQWIDNLGCDANVFTYTQVSFTDLLSITLADDTIAPHIWALGWGADYPDENNWVGDVLACDSNYQFRFRRSCNGLDDLIIQARQETDPGTRISLYQQIEDAFFGSIGEYPMAPLFVRAYYEARYNRLTRTPALFGGEHWYQWHITPTIYYEETISPTGGQLVVPNQAVVSVPANMFTDIVTLSYTILQPQLPIMAYGETAVLPQITQPDVDVFFELNAVYVSNGLPAEPLSGQTINIVVSYQQDDVSPGVCETRLALYGWIPALKGTAVTGWIPALSVVNTDENTVAAELGNLGVKAILGDYCLHLPAVAR